MHVVVDNMRIPTSQLGIGGYGKVMLLDDSQIFSHIFVSKKWVCIGDGDGDVKGLRSDGSVLSQRIIQGGLAIIKGLPGIE